MAKRCDPIALHVICASTRARPMRWRLGLVRRGRAGAETGKVVIEERFENSDHTKRYERAKYHYNQPCYQPYHLRLGVLRVTL